MRRPLMAVLVVGLSLALTGPAASTTATPAPDPGPAGSGVFTTGYLNRPRVVDNGCVKGAQGRRVLILGDSITVYTKEPLIAALREAGWSVCIDARRAQRTENTLDYYKAAGKFPAYVDVIVMATGTNDIYDPARMPNQVARARTYAGTRPLLWVTTWAHRRTGDVRLASHDLANSVRVNTAVRRSPRCTKVTAVIDWYSYLQGRAGRPAGYLVDGVHTTVAGGTVRNALIVAGLAPYRR